MNAGKHLQYGQWIQIADDGSLQAVAYDPKLWQGPIDMTCNGFVSVVIKTGADRFACLLSELKDAIKSIEADGDYVREVFVQRQGSLS